VKMSFALYPAKAQFRPGEPVVLVLEGRVDGGAAGNAPGNRAEPVGTGPEFFPIAGEHADAEIRGELDLAVYRLEREVLRMRTPVALRPGQGRWEVTLGNAWETREDVSVGYGVDAVLRLTDGAGTEPAARNSGAFTLSTAFDVADHWKRAPRYGFLSDFHEPEQGNLADADSLLRYHLNVVQFYDWMYRHDELVPPADVFTDPMGRVLSYSVVREKIEALRQRGMAALAYAAVYAALQDFHAAHPDWGLYKANGDPYELIGLFYIMDISPGSPWTDHIVAEFRRVIAEAGFDGLHLDQYGFPKRALRLRRAGGGSAAGLNGSGPGDTEPVDLAECYPQLIDRIKRELTPLRPDVGLIFNNVSAYPVHATAAADQEAVYIEVWPPYDRYADLKRLIDRGRELGRGKHVILAAYLHAFQEAMPAKPAGDGPLPAEAESRVIAAENGALLTMAAIFASGGFHLAIGEDQAVLTEAYYPDHRPMRPAFAAEVQRWYDFAVRYSEALYGFDLVDVSMTYTGGINSEVRFFHVSASFHPGGLPDTVWTLVKRSRDGLLLHLINLTGVESDRWNEGKPRRPRVLEDIRCEVAAETEVTGVYAASPDDGTAALKPVPFVLEDSAEHGKKAVFTLPPLRIWTMVRIRVR